MSLYILRWNPNISSYTPKMHKQTIKNLLKSKDYSITNWSIREWENLKKDDLFILQRVGTKHDGIAMIGKFLDECYEDENYKYKEGNDPDIVVHYADMIILSAFDCDKENPLPADKMEIIFPEIEWHHGHSGVEVPEKIGDKLMNYINKELIKQEIWDEASLQSLIDFEIPEVYDDENEDEITELLQLKRYFFENKTKENFFKLLCCLHDSSIYVPVRVDSAGHRFPIVVTNDKGEEAFPIFSDISEAGNNYDEVEDSNFVTLPLLECFGFVDELEDCSEIVMDPFTQPFNINKDLQEYIKSITPSE